MLDLALIKKSAIAASIFALLIIAAALILNTSFMFMLGVAVGAFLSIGLFLLFTRLNLRYWQNHKNAKEEISIGPILFLSFFKIILLGALLFALVYFARIDPLGLVFGVSTFYISLAFVPIFSKPRSAGEGEDLGEQEPEP
ncbi:MAG: hypothetical protein WC966_05135 [Bradymonadales bacterium]|jgi:L-asparagine transporter-like permease